MGFVDKIKEALSMPEEVYPEGMDMEEEEEDYSYSRPRTQHRAKQYDSEAAADNVVDIHSSPVQSVQPARASSKAHVVFKKIDSFEEVRSVADVLIEQRIVILNLETCADDDSRRILDVLSGVAYANDGRIQRVAGRAYIITPNNVPLSGELLDEVANSAANNSVF